MSRFRPLVLIWLGFVSTIALEAQTSAALSCPLDGDAKPASVKALNRLKNRTTAPTAADFDSAVTMAVTIAPGDSLRGTAYLRYSTDSPALLFTLAQTTTWNIASQDTLTVRTLNAGVRDARAEVSFAVRGPTKPGAFWLLWTHSAEPAAVWLLSGTNWSCHTPDWNDGNDLATQPDTALAAGVSSGEIWIKFIYCTPTSRSAAMRQLLIAGMRVVVHPR